MFDAVKAALSAALFKLARAMVPSKVPDAQLFEHSRVLFAYLLSTSTAKHAETEVWQELDFTDEASGERLEAPVKVLLPAADGNAQMDGSQSEKKSDKKSGDESEDEEAESEDEDESEEDEDEVGGRQPKARLFSELSLKDLMPGGKKFDAKTPVQFGIDFAHLSPSAVVSVPRPQWLFQTSPI
jgi:hypothetical protein